MRGALCLAALGGSTLTLREVFFATHRSRRKMIKNISRLRAAKSATRLA